MELMVLLFCTICFQSQLFEVLGNRKVNHLQKRVGLLEDRVHLDATTFRDEIDDLKKALNASFNNRDFDQDLGVPEKSSQCVIESRTDGDDDLNSMETLIKLGFGSEKSAIREFLRLSKKEYEVFRHDLKVKVNELQTSYENANAVTQGKVDDMGHAFENELNDFGSMFNKSAHERENLKADIESVFLRVDQIENEVSRDLDDDILELKRDVDVLSKAMDAFTSKQTAFEASAELLFESLGVIRHGSSFYILGTEERTWKSAMEDCKRRGAYLVEIDNKEENDWLIDMSKNRLPYHLYGFWTGGSDKNLEGMWIWMSSGRPVSGKHVNWGRGQPDNRGGDEDCLHLIRKYDYAWNDSPCATTMYYFCEKDLSY